MRPNSIAKLPSETFANYPKARELRSLLTRLGIYFDSDFDCLSGQIVRMLAQRDQWRFSEEMSARSLRFLLLLKAAERVLRKCIQRARRGRLHRHNGSGDRGSRLARTAERRSLRLDYRIQHLLVDEFQDTSLAQYELLEALTAQWSEATAARCFWWAIRCRASIGFAGPKSRCF